MATQFLSPEKTFTANTGKSRCKRPVYGKSVGEQQSADLISETKLAHCESSHLTYAVYLSYASFQFVVKLRCIALRLQYYDATDNGAKHS